MTAGTSTYPGDPSPERIRRARMGRRGGIAVLTLVVLAALAGLVGPREATGTASSGGYVLEVTHPLVSRAGLPASTTIEVISAGGFDGPLTVAVSRSYLELFDVEQVLPEPTGATADPERVLWELEPPPGERLRLVIDARLQPGRYRGADGFVAVVDTAADAELVRVPVSTKVVP